MRRTWASPGHHGACPKALSPGAGSVPLAHPTHGHSPPCLLGPSRSRLQGAAIVCGFIAGRPGPSSGDLPTRGGRGQAISPLRSSPVGRSCNSATVMSALRLATDVPAVIPHHGRHHQSAELEVAIRSWSCLVTNRPGPADHRHRRPSLKGCTAWADRGLETPTARDAGGTISEKLVPEDSGTSASETTK